jgi:hypothetical protein
VQVEQADPRRARWRIMAPLLLVAVAIAVLVSVGRGTPKVCAGQCKAPYLLDVTFSPATTPTVATSEVQQCASRPEVVGVGPARAAQGGMTVPVYTRDLGRTAKTTSVLSCLSGLPGVQTVAYPG